MATISEKKFLVPVSYSLSDNRPSCGGPYEFEGRYNKDRFPYIVLVDEKTKTVWCDLKKANWTHLFLKMLPLPIVDSGSAPFFIPEKAIKTFLKLEKKANTEQWKDYESNRPEEGKVGKKLV